jgi:hypothetical protein
LRLLQKPKSVSDVTGIICNYEPESSKKFEFRPTVFPDRSAPIRTADIDKTVRRQRRAAAMAIARQGDPQGEGAAGP